MYQFIKSEIEENTYFFTNQFGNSYEVYFVKTPSYFEAHNDFNNNIFELVIKLVENQYQSKFDQNIPPTIAAIFLDFFQSHEKVVVFSCDTTDSKQAARNRKFDDWFLRFNDDTFIKINGVIDDLEYETQYFMSAILRKDNPQKEEIIKAFEELTRGLTEAK